MIGGNCTEFAAMWTELNSADIKRVKQELQDRRSEMLVRHAEELTALYQVPLIRTDVPNCAGRWT